MSRQIIFHGQYFLDFYNDLNIKVKEKIQFVFQLIKQIEKIPKKFIAPIIGYEGLFEIRIEYESNIYRIFCCFDKGNVIVLFNAFQKKTQKTPAKEIAKAMKLKQEYFKHQI
ncbi:MAG: type II toxin-antitoxin system RelE/ParE family toxin [Bacteroidota bacterium]